MSPKTKTRWAPASKIASWKEHLGNWRTFAAVGGASLAAATNADAGIVLSGPVNLTVSIPTTGFHYSSKLFKIGGLNEFLSVHRSSKGAGVKLRNAGGNIDFATQNSSLHVAKKYATGIPLMLCTRPEAW
jgi:hypothetical protein